MNVDPACPLFETRDRRDEFAGAQLRDAVAATYVAYVVGGVAADAKGDIEAVANKSLLVGAPFVGSLDIVRGLHSGLSALGLSQFDSEYREHIRPFG